MSPSISDEKTSADEQLLRGQARLKAGDPAGALGEFSRGIRLHPADWRFPCDAATILYKERRISEAVRLMSHAMRLAPRNTFLLHKLLGRCFWF